MAKKSKNILRTKKSFSGTQILLFVLAFAAVGTVAVWQTLAAPHNGGGGPSKGSTSTITGPVMVTDTNSDGLPNHGDVITFNESTTATDQPFVNLQCSQNGVLVTDGWNGFFDGSLNTTRNFGLNSGAWQSGAADCTVYLDKHVKSGQQWQQLASTSFHVNP